MKKFFERILISIVLFVMVFSPMTVSAVFDTDMYRRIQAPRIDNTSYEILSHNTRENIFNNAQTGVRRRVDRERGWTSKVDTNILPELFIKSVHLIDVSSLNDSMVYHFDISIKNSQMNENVSQQEVGIAKGNNVLLSVIDATEADSKMNDDITYKSLVNTFSIKNLYLNDGGEFILNPEDEVVYTLDVSIPVQEKNKKIMFLLDPTNQIKEYNDQTNQTVNSLVVTKDNNFFSYNIGQPYDEFEININQYQKENNSISIHTIIPFYASDLETDIFASDIYDISTEVWDIKNSNAFSDTVNSIKDVVNDVSILHGYPNMSLDMNQVSVLDSKKMEFDGFMSKSIENITTYVNDTQYIVLVIHSIDGTKIPVYMIQVISDNTDIVDTSIDCSSTTTEECASLVFQRVSSRVIYADNENISETNPLEASTFEFCNYGDSPATVESLSFDSYIKGVDYNYNSISNDYMIKTSYKIDDVEIWDPIVLNYIENAGFKKKEIVLQNPLIIQANECHILSVDILESGNKNIFFYQNIGFVKSNVPVFGYDPYIEQFIPLFQTGESDFFKKKLEGTYSVFQDEKGFILNFADVYKEEYKVTDGLIPNIFNISLYTDGNQIAKIDTLHFSVESSFSGTLSAKLDMNKSVNQLYTHSFLAEFNNTSYFDIPANGEFDIDLDNVNFDVGQKFNLHMSLLGPFQEGDVTISLVGIDSDADIIYNNTINSNDMSLLLNNISNLEYFSPITYPLSNTVHIIDPSKNGGSVAEAEININQINYWTSSYWYSSTDYENGENFLDADFYFNGYYDSLPDLFNLLSAESVHFSPWKMEVQGLYDGTIDLEVVVASGDTETTQIMNVALGDIFYVDIPEWQPGTTPPQVHIRPASYPNNPLLELTHIQIIPYPIEMGTDSSTFDVDINTYVYDVDDSDFKYVVKAYTEPQEFTNVYTLGKEALYLTNNYNSITPKTKLLVTLDENEHIDMNEVCFTAIGNIELEQVTYTHDAHDEQPFDKVMLQQDSMITYLPLNEWGETTVNFFPNPKGTFNHGSSVCINLSVIGPKEKLSSTFFDLTEIKATIMGSDNISVPVIIDTNNLMELSEENKIKGTVYSFK